MANPAPALKPHYAANPAVATTITTSTFVTTPITASTAVTSSNVATSSTTSTTPTPVFAAAIASNATSPTTASASGTTTVSIPVASASTVSATARSPTAATMSEVNKTRICSVVNRLSMHFQSGFRSDVNEFLQLCFALARGIDYAISHSDITPNAHDIPPLLRQVYQRRKEESLQAAIMVLLISVKNACKKKWFQTADSEELLMMENEMSKSFSIADNITSGSSNVLRVISEVIIPRYYPRIKLRRLIASFEVKVGYEVLVADIFIPRNIAGEERIRLFVVQSDNTASSACIINPPQVNFLVNGKGVERRTNVSLDNGPQFPTDITKMLKYGMNLFQVVGSFSGNCIIAIAITTEVSDLGVPELQDYVQPVVAAVTSDTEIIEGPSRISLNCPISFKRIRIPVKGHLCKHHQCFDFNNYMDMNSRKPYWHCPHCNQPVSCMDIRIDRNMVKIVGEAGEGVSDVILSADGTWKEAEGQSNTASHKKAPMDNHVSNARCESIRAGSDLGIMDLTEEDNCEDDMIKDARVVVSQSVYPIPGGSNPCESGDRKPFQDIFQHLQDLSPTSQTIELIPPVSIGTWSSILPSSLAYNSPALDNIGANGQTLAAPESYANTTANAASVGINQDNSHLDIVVQSTGQTTAQERQYLNNLQLQQQQSGGSVVINEVQRPPIPRHVTRTPVAIQALAATQNQNHTRMRRMGALSPVSVISGSSSGMSYHLSHPQAVVQDGMTRVATSGMERHQFSTSAGIASSMQHHSAVQQSLVHTPGLRPSQYLVGTRAALDLPRALGHSGPYIQPHSDVLNSFHRQVNSPQTFSQLANTLPQSPSFPPRHQWASQNAVSVTAGSFQQSLLAEGRAALLARMQPGLSSLQVSMPTPPPVTTDMPSFSAQMLHMEGGIRQATMRPDSILESPTEPNWRPTGRMRGSLSGAAYSAAVSRYAAQTTQPLAGSPIAPIVSSSVDQLSVLVPNNSNVQASPSDPR